jgi:hypothetical protein
MEVLPCKSIKCWMICNYRTLVAETVDQMWNEDLSGWVEEDKVLPLIVLLLIPICYSDSAEANLLLVPLLRLLLLLPLRLQATNQPNRITNFPERRTFFHVIRVRSNSHMTIAVLPKYI